LVKKDGVAVGRDAWVEIFKLVSGNWNWVASSNTDNSGYATFNLSGYDKTNDRFVVRVNAPWNLRATYSSKTYDNTGSGLAWSAIDYTTNNANSFSLATPNLRLIIKANSTTVNKWGWVGIEKYDSSGNYQSWVGSYGLDEVGKAAVLIPSSGKFKITSYPGPGKPGAATSCFVNTSAGGAISSFETCTAGSHVVVGGIEELSLTLNSGNIIGHVTRSTGGTAVVGAVVYANWASDFYNDANAVVTSTDENGNYGLQLDPSKQWKIKIIPMTPTDGSAKLASSTSATFTPPGSGSNNIDFQLGNA
jgi:hypothetical protein